MKVLITKLSSMGDVIHTLPAVTDAYQHIPGIQFDWLVEPAFSEIPKWHPAVRRVIAFALRKWRKNWKEAFKNHEIQTTIRAIRQEKYDAIIDGQSSIKSALVSMFARGIRYGLNYRSARENIAALTYHHRFDIVKEQHAIQRLRILFAKSLNYQFDTEFLDYGIQTDVFNFYDVPMNNKSLAIKDFAKTTAFVSNTSDAFDFFNFEINQPYVLLVHSASWSTKLWPIHHWQKLIELVQKAGLIALIPWGNELERERAQQIAGVFTCAHVLPHCSLAQLGYFMKNAKGVISVDTGLAHLAAALNIPTVSMYGPTDSERIGTKGQYQLHLEPNFSCLKCKKKTCHYHKNSLEAFCLAQLMPEQIWSKFCQLVKIK